METQNEHAPYSGAQLEDLKHRRASKRAPRRERDMDTIYSDGNYANTLFPEARENFLAEVALEWLEVHEDDIPQFCILAGAIQEAGEREARLLATIDAMRAQFLPYTLVSDGLPPVENECIDEEGEGFFHSDEMLVRYRHPQFERLPVAANAFGCMATLATLDGDGAWRETETGHIVKNVVAWMPLPPLNENSVPLRNGKDGLECPA